MYTVITRHTNIWIKGCLIIWVPAHSLHPTPLVPPLWRPKCWAFVIMVQQVQTWQTVGFALLSSVEIVRSLILELNIFLFRGFRYSDNTNPKPVSCSRVLPRVVGFALSSVWECVGWLAFTLPCLFCNTSCVNIVLLNDSEGCCLSRLRWDL